MTQLDRLARRETELLTPEGVPLRLDLAEPGERIVAFVADVFLSFAGALLVLLAGTLLMAMTFTFTLPVALLLAFLVRNAYFIFFELHWAGVTPGKRFVGIRVIDRRGGPLTAGAVIARNLTRQAEFFLPVELLLATRGWLWSPWDVLPCGIWLAAMLVLVLGTRQRLRLGDLIGGTMVIAAPQRLLLDDLAREDRIFEFTFDQLQVYGIHELQVLEDVLRQPHNVETARLLRDIRDRIARRIQWSRPLPEADTYTFLRDFYTAQRAFLEQRKNIGEERLDKFHRS